MAEYFVDDAGNNTTGADWTNAYTSINALDAAVALASGDIVYFGHDSQCQAVNAANLTITGPASGLPVKFISATTGSNPPTYQQATANQIDTTEGNYYIYFNGVFALEGMKVVSGGQIWTPNNNAASFNARNCIFALGANQYFQQYISPVFLDDCVIDLTADGTTARTNVIFYQGDLVAKGLTFVNAGYRTGAIFANNFSTRISGGDYSGFTNATTCEIIAGTSITSSNKASITDAKTAATWTPFAAGAIVGFEGKAINCGSADQPVALYTQTYYGAIASSSSIYRTGGGTAEGTAFALLVTTTANCSPETPFCTDWFYNTLSTTGSKTWKAYVVNDTADLNDNEAWLEIQYKATASSGQWTTVTDKPATITTAAAAQTDDTTSTWNGTGPSFTYKQELSVTATVNQTGQWRARICFGKASVSAASYLYVDPKVTAS